MFQKISGGFCLFCGLAMLVMWVILVGSGNVVELKTSPQAILFHLAAELMVALLLLVAGIGQLFRKDFAPKFMYLALGGLSYSVLNAAGFYAQLGDWTMPAFFLLLFTCSVVIVVISLSKGKKAEKWER